MIFDRELRQAGTHYGTRLHDLSRRRITVIAPYLGVGTNTYDVIILL